jgi:hypothetical protein
MEVNGTGPSPSVRLPWLQPNTFKKLITKGILFCKKSIAATVSPISRYKTPTGNHTRQAARPTDVPAVTANNFAAVTNRTKTHNKTCSRCN